MIVIPVIDLMGGQAVHARRGDRARYQPLRSSLSASSEPLAVVAALRSLAPFTCLYVADLDAIRRTSPGHRETLESIAARWPDLEIWLDTGIGDAESLRAWLDAFRPRGRAPIPVVGSESLASAEALADMRRIAPRAILSLDTRGEEQLGPAALFESSALWPDRVIVMTLDRVGAGEGPALDRLRDAVARAPTRRVVAAGGVRGPHDLERLEAMGVHAVLLASALHDGSLDRAALGRYLPA